MRLSLFRAATFRAACGMTLATLLLGVPAALAMDDDKDDDGNQSRHRARFGVMKTDDFVVDEQSLEVVDEQSLEVVDEQSLEVVDEQSLEVVIENGDVTVKMDGKEVPDGQVIREDGTIVIRDADGNEIRTIKIADRPGHFMDFSFGDGENRVWVVGDGEPAPEPTVMLGIQLGAPGPALEHHLGLEPGTATMIVGLYEGLPAHAAGLGEHDIITHIGGVPADPKSLRAALANSEPGDVVILKAIQRGKPRQVEVELLAYDRAAMAKAKLIGAGNRFATLFGGDAAIAIDPEGENQWFGEIRDLTRVFIDDSDRVFEFAPGTVPWKERNEFFPADKNGDELDSRLQRLDRRLADLQKVLDALIEEAKRQEDER